MSFYVELSINDEWLGTLVATRTSGGDSFPDSINRYEIRHYAPRGVTQLVLPDITHRYGDGAFPLAGRMLALAGAALVTAETVGEPE